MQSARSRALPEDRLRHQLAHTGNMGGLAGADAICGQRAAAAGLSGTFKAWLSDSTGSPSTRFAQSALPYVRTDGVTVAANWADLTDGALAAPINVNEAGAVVANMDGAAVGWAWSATGANGAGPAAATCNDWSLADGGNQGGKGNTHAGDASWSTNFNPGSFNCRHQPARLYCVQQ